MPGIYDVSPDGFKCLVMTLELSKPKSAKARGKSFCSTHNVLRFSATVVDPETLVDFCVLAGSGSMVMISAHTFGDFVSIRVARYLNV